MLLLLLRRRRWWCCTINPVHFGNAGILHDVDGGTVGIATCMPCLRVRFAAQEPAQLLLLEFFSSTFQQHLAQVALHLHVEPRQSPNIHIAARRKLLVRHTAQLRGHEKARLLRERVRVRQPRKQRIAAAVVFVSARALAFAFTVAFATRQGPWIQQPLEAIYDDDNNPTH